jgi:murein L,D-transpeptidase YafK
MYAYSKNKCIKIYDIALGRQAVGKKHFEGDLKTPEGLYSIHDKNPNSRYHKNLGVSYPNQQDLNYAQKNKLPAGGDIKIHGLRNYFGWIGPWHRTMDWTLGCIALTNEEVDELFQYINIGTPILIQP